MMMKKIIYLVLAGLIGLGESITSESISVSLETYGGTAYEAGIEEGKAVLRMNPYIGQVLKAPVFTQTTKENFAAASSLLKSFDPELLAEMKGFAVGANLSFEDVVVKFSGYGFTGIPIDRGCTQIALLSGSTADQHTLVGRNYDFTPDKKLTDFRLVALYTKSFQPSLGTSQFIFGRIEGMNAAGLYAGISVAHGKGTDSGGFFFPIIVRMILDTCTNTDEALSLIQKIPHSCSYNYLLADKNSAVAVEVSPQKFAKRYPKAGNLFVVNHYLSPDMRTEQKKLLPNSLARKTLLETKLKTMQNLSDLKTILSSKMPLGVCQHYYKESLGTLWSAIFDPTEMKVYYAFGSPALNEYRTFDLGRQETISGNYQGKLPESDKLP